MTDWMSTGNPILFGSITASKLHINGKISIKNLILVIMRLFLPFHFTLKYYHKVVMNQRLGSTDVHLYAHNHNQNKKKIKSNSNL